MKKVVMAAVAAVIASVSVASAHHTGAPKLNGDGYSYVEFRNHGWFNIEVQNSEAKNGYINTSANARTGGKTLSLGQSETLKSWDGKFAVRVDCAGHHTSNVLNFTLDDAITWGAAHHNVTNKIVFEWHGTCFNPSNRVFFDAPVH